jgi:hypothetical protein
MIFFVMEYSTPESLLFWMYVHICIFYKLELYFSVRCAYHTPKKSRLGIIGRKNHVSMWIKVFLYIFKLFYPKIGQLQNTILFDGF